MLASARHLSVLVVLVLVIFLTDGQDASAILVVDFSPDTTSAVLSSGARENQYQGQIVGDQFTLSENTVLTGGSIFSDNNTTAGEVGDDVRFLVFADPLAAPILNIGATLDAVDTLFTTTNTTTNAMSESPLARKHVTIAPTPLSAGTYWFSMPGDGLNIRQGTGDYGGGGFRNGPPNLSGTTPGGGDMFFQLEAVPEPAAFILAAIGILSLLGPRRRRF